MPHYLNYFTTSYEHPSNAKSNLQIPRYSQYVQGISSPDFFGLMSIFPPTKSSHSLSVTALTCPCSSSNSASLKRASVFLNSPSFFFDSAMTSELSSNSPAMFLITSGSSTRIHLRLNSPLSSFDIISVIPESLCPLTSILGSDIKK